MADEAFETLTQRTVCAFLLMSTMVMCAYMSFMHAMGSVMNMIFARLTRLLPLLCVLAAGAAQAQSVGECPMLPGDSGLRWQKLDGPDFTFCKAIRTSDDAEVFAVMLSGQSSFDARRSNRAEEATIDGHPVRWYRSEIASSPSTQVRETLVELGDGRIAHISLRADSEADLAEALQDAGSIRFQGQQLSSN